MKTGKRIISVLLSVIMALGVCAAAPVTAGAEFDEVDGIKWSYEILEGSTGVRIIPGSEPADAAVSISGNIAIPSVLHLDDRDYIVIEIGDGAFNDVMFSGVTGITIPDTVRTIGNRAFQNMTNLTSVSFGEGSALTTIGVNAFYGCKNLSSIDIPQGVTTIGNYAFYNCESLSSVVIPDNVTTLGNYAFRNCSNIQSAVIGANVPSLNGTFIYCGNLESVTISSNSVTDFSGSTFYGCGSLTSITIPCNFDKAKFTSGSSYINVNDVGDTFTVQGTSASGTFSYTHNYGEPVWNWDDVSHPTYTAYCAGCGDEKTGEADSVTVTHNDPDGAVPGYTEAKASVVIDGETYESTHAVDAFEISDYAELKEFASRVNGGETGLIGVLTADIDASASDPEAAGYDSANDWTPIGNEYNNYTGTFDGLGHTITGLTYNNPQQDYAGLFGYVGDGGKVMNVGLEGGSITGQKYVGGVVGYSYDNSSVENCYNTGDVSGKNYVGGVVGYNISSTVSNCYNTGSITATGDLAYVGGVVGDNAGGSSVENCYNTGSVTATAAYARVGGVVGLNYYNSSVENSYNTGSVTATAADAYAGGVCGYNYSDCNDCYYDRTAVTIPGASADNNWKAISNTTADTVTGLTTDGMTGTAAIGTAHNQMNFSDTSVWLVRESDEFYSYYPHLKGFNLDKNGNQLAAEDIRKTDWPARLPKDGVCEISDYAQLKEFASRVNGGEMGLIGVLAKNIDASASAEANDWTPIGNDDKPYTGTFDGDGHIITGLTYNNPNQNYAGLFGYVGEGGKVQYVGLEGGSITGQKYVGGVVGINYNGVINCYNTGGVSGKDYVGGVVGYNYNSSVSSCYNTGSVTATANFAYAGGVVGENCANSSVENCYNTGSVTATEQYAYAGGVVGENCANSSVENCYNTGSVTATEQYAYAGGVVGYNVNNSSVENCYNIGDVSGNHYVGGVVGENYLENSSVKNCCYDLDRAPGISAIGKESSATSSNVTGLTTAQMTGANALDNMTFAYEAGEESPWQTRANDDINSFYPHLKGFAYDSEPTAENWPPKIVNVIEYPLWVGGNQVTSDNADSLAELDGIAVSDGGSVRFVPDADGKGGTLYLNNATITGTQSYKSGGTHDSNILVENKEFNITINLEGENTLGPAERGIWMVNNSASSGLALTGDGKLSITAEKNGILINCDLLIDGADINVTATGGDSGGTGIIADDIDIRNSSVYAEGTGDQYGIFCASALTISDSSVESGCTGTYGRGLYFSDEENFTVSGDSFVTLEGGTRYGALWIKGSLITENGNEIVEPANYIIDPLETGSDVYLVYGVTADEKIPAVNVIITNPLTITVTANPTGGGTITGGGKTYKGADVALTAAPETGYDFVSWTEGTSVVSTNAKYLFTVEQSRNLVANFKLQVKSVSVSANLPDGGTVSGAGTYNYGENATVTALSKDHYSFVNWTENGAEVSTNANYSFPVTGDRNLVANFAKDKHTVEFVNDDGTELQSGDVAYGETPKYTGKTPTKEATAEYTYTFAGWSPEISEVTGDATYTATYTETPIDYKLTWKVDGESYKNETIPFGSNITEPEVDERAGYIFAWVDEIPATMPAEDVTINGKFTVIEYTATFVDENGETVEKVTFTVETESITEPAVPEKTGYTGEWEEYTLGTSDITIKPVYKGIASVEIEDFEEQSEIGYREDVTYTADATDLPEGAEVHWFVNGEDVGTGESYTVEDPTDDYTVQAKVIDKDGNVLDESSVAKVKVKNGFFDRLKAFFAELIEKILGKAIIDILTSIC